MRKAIAAATVLNAFSSLCPQIIGLLFLDAVEFGRFSVTYLIYSLSISLLMSVLCDVWVVWSPIEKTPGRPLYASVLSGFSVLAGLGGVMAGALFLADAAGAAIVGFAVAAATFRIGARYYLTYLRRWATIAVSDTVMLFATVIVFFLLSRAVSDLQALLLAWAVGSIGACVGAFRPRFQFRSAIVWIGERRRAISPLLIESLAMNLSAIGTPFILLPVLGMRGFGVYRAVSNLGAPVRLAIAPLRPLILGSPHRFLAARYILTVAVLGIGVGVLVAISLLLVDASGVGLGVLSELSRYAVPTGIYMLSELMIGIYSLVVRAKSNVRMLFAGRAIQTVVGLVFPLLGFLMGGLYGAIWGFALGTLLSGIVWAGCARFELPRRDSSRG